MTFPTTRIPTSLPVPPYGTRVAHGFPTSTCINHEVRSLDLPAEHRDYLSVSIYPGLIPSDFRCILLLLSSHQISQNLLQKKKKERKKERKKQINHYGIQVNKSKRKEKKSKLETFGYPFTETTIEKLDRGKALINEYI